MKRYNVGIHSTIKFLVFILLISAAGQAFAQQRVSINASVANIRYDAGTKYKILWQVERYHPFIVVEERGKWRLVKDYENDMGWVHESLLGNLKSVITKEDKCNIRSKPTTKSSIRFTAEKGVPFKVLDTNGNWIKVEHADGDVGWIYKTLVW